MVTPLVILVILLLLINSLLFIKIFQNRVRYTGTDCITYM